MFAKKLDKNLVAIAIEGDKHVSERVIFRSLRSVLIPTSCCAGLPTNTTQPPPYTYPSILVSYVGPTSYINQLPVSLLEHLSLNN